MVCRYRGRQVGDVPDNTFRRRVCAVSILSGPVLTLFEQALVSADPVYIQNLRFKDGAAGLEVDQPHQLCHTAPGARQAV